ncbi:hypothetical protein V6Z88_004583, partial [Aspergillus fumigatus]
ISSQFPPSASTAHREFSIHRQARRLPQDDKSRAFQTKAYLPGQLSTDTTKTYHATNHKSTPLRLRLMTPSLSAF